MTNATKCHSGLTQVSVVHWLISPQYAYHQWCSVQCCIKEFLQFVRSHIN